MVALFLTFPGPILALFLDMGKPEVGPRSSPMARCLLALAALFQLGDAMQVMALGLLRGIRDTRVPMWAAAFSYWVIGIPVSYVSGLSRWDLAASGCGWGWWSDWLRPRRR